MAKSKAKKRKSFLKLIKSAFSELEQCERVDIEDTYKLPNKRVMIPLERYPLQLHVGKHSQVLHLYPELPLNEQDGDLSEPDYILFEPQSYYSTISGFYRLSDDDKIVLGSDKIEQGDFLNLQKNISKQKLSISNHEGRLTFKSHHPDSDSCISPLFKEKKLNKINDWRNKKVKRLAKILGDPSKLLSTEEAFTLIQQVNKIIDSEKYRQLNSDHQPGGVLSIPDNMKAIIMGDLHTCLDNLLTILSQNNFLEALENNEACLIILGDAVHPEIEGQYDKMTSSMLIMDIIFKLKCHFPENVFYLCGNHDSFSEHLSKRGVPQGLLWGKELKKSRGKQYKKAMQKFYDNSAYLAYSRHFICCHAGPPTTEVDLQALVNIKHDPILIKDLISNRLHNPHRLSGYKKSDIKTLRHSLGVATHTPFIVGHTPMDNHETLWENVGGIAGHTIVYGGNLEWVGVMAQIGDGMYPLTYPVENLTELISKADK